MGLKNLPHVYQKFKKFTIPLVPCAAFLFLILLYQSVMEVSIRRTSLMKRKTAIKNRNKINADYADSQV